MPEQFSRQAWLRQAQPPTGSFPEPVEGNRAEATSGLVTDVIEFSAVDGPGNRFVVFTQGCNFNCVACHNPYTINVCIDCGLCVDGCPSGALGMDASGHITWDAAICTGSDVCVATCPYDSTPKARTTEVSALLGRIRRAAPFLSGVTVSGGEATQQAGFVRDLFAAVKAELPGLTCFVDSNGAAPASTWDLLDPVMDAAMIDLKCFDDEIHRRLVGSSNAEVLGSIRLLAARRKLHETRLLIVPGQNDADDLLARTGRWLAAIDPRMRVKVIGFRHHGVRPSPVPLLEPSAEQREHYADVLRREGEFDLVVV